MTQMSLSVATGRFWQPESIALYKTWAPFFSTNPTQLHRFSYNFSGSTKRDMRENGSGFISKFSDRMLNDIFYFAWADNVKGF